MFRRVGLAIEPGKVDYFEVIRPETADEVLTSVWISV
jgi:hypothetical protein